MAKIELDDVHLHDHSATDAPDFVINEFSSEVERSLVASDGGSALTKLRSMGKRRRDRHILIGTLMFADIVAIVAAFFIASLIRLGFLDWDQLSKILLTIVPIHLVIALNNKGYRSNVLNHLWKSISRGLVAFLVAASSMLLILFMFKTSSDFSRLLFGIGAALGVLQIVLFRLVINRLSRAWLGPNPYGDLCIYDDVPYQHSNNSSSILASDHQLTADARNPVAVSRLGEVVNGMDRVVIHCSEEKRANWVFMLRSLDISSEIVVPELDHVQPLAIKRRNGRTSLLISMGQLRWDQKFLKRSFDLFVCTSSLPFVLMIIGLAAIAIKVESRGPVFFRQERIGLGNRRFKIWKLRSMKAENTDMNGNRSAARDDDRITRVGAFIRRTSIDELPQIFNVLVGDMSVVGPRPHAVGSRAENQLFWDIDERYWHRHSVKPGLTGLAQIRGYRGATHQEEDLSNRLQSDLEYVADWSLWGDVRIFFKTFSVLIHKNAF